MRKNVKGVYRDGDRDVAMCSVSGVVVRGDRDDCMRLLNDSCPGHKHWNDMADMVDGGKRFEPAPAPSSGPEVKVGTWWRRKCGGTDPCITITGRDQDGDAEFRYYRDDGEPGGVNALHDSVLVDRYAPIPAPPWAKQEAPRAIGATCDGCGESEATGGKAVSMRPNGARTCDACAAPRAVQNGTAAAKIPACGHCKAPGTFPERVLGRHATRVNLCDTCMVTYERVTFPAGGTVEPAKATTWAPGCSDKTRVRLEMELGWDRRGRR